MCQYHYLLSGCHEDRRVNRRSNLFQNGDVYFEDVNVNCDPEHDWMAIVDLATSSFILFTVNSARKKSKLFARARPSTYACKKSRKLRRLTRENIWKKSPKSSKMLFRTRQPRSLGTSDSFCHAFSFAWLSLARAYQAAARKIEFHSSFGSHVGRTAWWVAMAYFLNIFVKNIVSDIVWNSISGI